MDYSNLRNKTIFDFTKDDKILEKVFSEGIYMDYLENQEEFIKNFKECLQPRAIVRHIIIFSRLIINDKLYNSLKNEFEDMYPNDFREVGDPVYFV